MPSFEMRHIVTFDETNLLGNVYYVHFLRWQGHCRELFLRDHVPAILRELDDGLTLVTLHCSCDYLAELEALDLVVVRMSLAGTVQNRLELAFEMARQGDGGVEELVARGRQVVACMARHADGLVAVPIPPSLQMALAPYRSD